ncbi:MAG: Two component transcriptional regulator, winged helix family [Parcubacteria group bacterium GW2011_GWE2_39_37]|uniref:Two component transcriptional regulator, winged helix family n=1 Tax=Candidatus Falkowbacteria bacterium GW2011_GWF2_39_8 TaxID=1618642 RepID=A0A0G0T6P3_9BACT|nr:MAG: Two component transcriptional regulator, winged helix family [Parcubacteria group bacterium GW2011_GWE2_39_37]KKR33517.1 MAG: Two component transcriptional regulator, winged helix family [Candidatus Falkowbacteria bacterium GW2011_GWF2_39_8]
MDKVFVIENDINIAHPLEANLSLNGFNSFIFADGEADEIIQKIISYDPQYIIADLVLPKTNGLELIERIKLNTELTELPVFIFTRVENPLIKSKCLQIGADYYFSSAEISLTDFIEKFKKIIINRKKNNSIC